VRKRQQLINFLSAAKRPYTALELMGLGNTMTEEQYASAKAIQQRLVWDLAESDMFIGTSDICEIINGSASSYPSAQLHASDMITATGMVYFVQPVTPVKEEADETDYFRAVSWSVIEIEEERTDAFGIREVRGTKRYVICIMGYRDTNTIRGASVFKNLPDLYPTVSVLWEVDDVHGGEIGYGEEDRLRRAPYVKLLLAYWTIVRQRLAVQEETKVQLSPKEFKIAKKGGYSRAKTNVTISRLRPRKTYEYTGDHGFNRPDWQHSWIVRSFWRMQFFPKTQEHKPVLVLSYPKGPPDKPLLGQERAWLPPKPLDGS
jgi:hypothetical protein